MARAQKVANLKLVRQNNSTSKKIDTWNNFSI